MFHWLKRIYYVLAHDSIVGQATVLGKGVIKVELKSHTGDIFCRFCEQIDPGEMLEWFTEGKGTDERILWIRFSTKSAKKVAWIVEP